MSDLKLGRLPDRTPVRITISVGPELNRALTEYAECYHAAYGQTEAISDLIPFMLEAFLESDRGFAKARKDGMTSAPPEATPRRARKPESSITPITEA
jgi:hypothetical protein